MDQESESSKSPICDDGNGSATDLNVEKANADQLQSVPKEDLSVTENYNTGGAKAGVNKDFTMEHRKQELEETSAIGSAATSQLSTNTPKIETQNATNNEASAVKSSSESVEETVDEICGGNQTLDTSLEIINEPNDAGKQGEVVVIQSVIQLAPPNVDNLKENTAAAESNNPSEIISVTEKLQTIDVIEEMDITENIHLNDSLEVQLVSETLPKSSNTQREAERRMCNIPKTAPSTSLGLLSQYGSDSDDDGQYSSGSDTASVVAVPTTVNKSYRSQVIEIDSDTDTDSSESVSSATESGDETEYLTKIAKVISKRIEEHDDDDYGDDDEDADGKDPKQRGRRKPPRVRGEMLLDELPPIQDLQISVPAEECIEFGRVHSIVDQLLLVSALPNSILLDLDTVLFLEQGKRVLGEVFDVLGQVADPLYCVRFNTNQQIHEKGINVGDVVYVAPKTDHTHYVILSSLTKMRGSDASWENDIEPPPRYLDYSDDEEEREARQELRKQRQRNRENGGNDNDEDNDEDEDENGADAKKRVRRQIKTEINGETTRPRRGRPNNGSTGRRNDTNDNNYQRRQQRFDAHSPAPHNYQPHQNTGSWHSHYNQQYPPPQHAYRSPYSGPYPYQRPMYNTTPPPPQRTQHFHPYMHRAPMATVHEHGHIMPPPSFSMPPPQMTHPPHNMSPQHISQPPPTNSIPMSPQRTPPPQYPSIPSGPLMPQMASQSFNMSPQQMLQRPPIHSMSPPEMSHPSQQMVQQSTAFLQTPMAGQSPSQPQPTNAIEKSVEPAPPGAD